jgi:hypothetical protein
MQLLVKNFLQFRPEDNTICHGPLPREAIPCGFQPGFLHRELARTLLLECKSRPAYNFIAHLHACRLGPLLPTELMGRILSGLAPETGCGFLSLRASGLLGGCPADLGTSPASSTALRSLSSVALSSGYRPLSYAPKTSLAPNALNSLLTEKLLNAYQPLKIKYANLSSIALGIAVT